MKNFITKKLLFFKLIIISKLILYLQSIECNKSYPILKNNECVSTYCNDVQFKEGECIIDNPIIKTTWLTYIIIFENTNGEIDFSWDLRYQRGIMLKTIYSNSSERTYYGMEYSSYSQCIFIDKDENYHQYIKKNINLFEANGITNSQSGFIRNGASFSYLISIGNKNSNIEILDINDYSKELIIISPENFLNSSNRIINGTSSFIGTGIFPYLIFCSIISEIDNPSNNYFGLFIYDISYNTPENLLELFYSNYLELVKGEIISCFNLEMEIGHLSCFYLSEDYNFTIITMFSEIEEDEDNPFTISHREKIGFLANTTNENIFFKGIFFERYKGIYCYFSGNSNEIPTFLFKQIDEDDLSLSNLFSEFPVVYLKEYTFNNDFKYNDIALSNLGEQKFYFVSTDIDKKFVIITKFEIFTSSSDENNLLIRYYIIKLQEYYNIKILNGLKAIVYNSLSSENFLSIAIDFGYYDLYQNSQEINNNQALIFFSFPNVTSKMDFDFIEYAFKNNLNYFIANFTENFLIENNIFGFHLDKIIIDGMTIKEGINYYDLKSGDLLDFVNYIDNVRKPEEDSIKIELAGDIIEKIRIYFKYGFIISTPINLEDYNNYCDNYNNEYGDINDTEFYKSPIERRIFSFYYYINITENLSRECNDTNCTLCLSDDRYYCLVCKDDNYTIIYNESSKYDKFKICYKEEEIIETTMREESSNNFDTTLITELITSNSLNNYDELTNDNKDMDKTIFSDFESLSNEKLSQIVEDTNSLISNDLKTITSTNLKTIIPTNLKTIIPTNLEKITSTNLETITSSNFKTIIPTNLKTIISTNLETITSTNFKTIIPTNLKTIISTNLKVITSTNLEPISKSNLETITSTNFKTITSNSLKVITSTNFKTTIQTNLESIESTNLEISSEKQIVKTEISSNNNINELSLLDLFGDKYKNIELSNEQIKELYKDLKNYILNDYDGNTIIINIRNFKIQISTLDEQKNEDSELSNVNLGNCEKVLREKYCKTDEDELVMLKFDITKNEEKSTYVQYEIYESNSKTFLELKECSSSDVIINVPFFLDSYLEFLYERLRISGYNLFDANDAFYNDICTVYSTENETDILLYDRRMDIYRKTLNISLCQVGCKFLSYNSKTKKAECDCPIQTNEINIDLSEIKFDSNKMVDEFYETLKNSNFKVLKCYRLVYNIKVFLKNYGCMIMTVLFLFFLILMIIAKLKSSIKINQYIQNIIKNKILSNENDSYKKLNNIKKNKIKNRKNKKELKKSIKKVSKKENKIWKKNKKKKTGIYQNPSVIDSNLNFKSEDISQNKDNKKTNIIKNLYQAPGKRKRNNKNLEKSKIDLKNKRDKTSISFLTSSVQKNLNKNKGPLNINEKNNENIYNINGTNINIYNNKIFKKKLLSDKKINNDKEEQKEDMNSLKINSIAQNSENNNLSKNLNDEEMNSLSYKKAIEIDKRNYFQYYISLIKKKQLILFTFIPTNDYNLMTLKISLFIVSFALYISINAFFFNDDTMHKIYKNNGIYNILSQIPQIIYSSLISATINFILKQLSLSEKNILKIKEEEDIDNIVKVSKEIQKWIKIKFISFFIISLILMIFFWYFISCFCGVYNNTQIILFKDTLISFALTMLYPFGLNILPGIFRIPALRAKKKDKNCLYSFSKILSYI